MAKLLLSHRYRTRREGVAAFVWSTLVMMAFIGFTQYFFPNSRKEDPTFFYVYYGLVFGIGGVMLLGYAIPNILMDREFRFELFEDRIECKSPAKIYGESYSIPISEIVELEKNICGEGCSWSFITQDGRKILITPNYGNPVQKIVKLLQQLIPDIYTKLV